MVLLAVALLTMQVASADILNPTTDTNHIRGTEMRCIQGGVQLHSVGAQRYELCAENHCHVKEHPPEQEDVIFPPEVILHNYNVQWKVHDGKQLTILETTCPSSSFCENIRCWFCTANIFNPECSPQSAIIASAITLYAFIALIYALCYVPVTVGKPCRLLVRGFWLAMLTIARLLKRLGYYAFIRRRQGPNRRHDIERFLRTPLVAVITLIATTVVLGCQELTSSCNQQRFALCRPKEGKRAYQKRRIKQRRTLL
ncbi:unnamed protein product [Nippostrongylus brasiliensis]|uniref:Methuselah_N domain-containing protein n=1 Tax=Nippostrongylus brasiliensis TaxID=27835 RepID=A0A0N4YKG5_NIPBR|nr:unnamed protein product [Nippostrongylus brasiliensis]